ncbi:radical SAM family heme chaperone HemW [bacterium]|nr:radical SAM family heme chaperone HemW [bacterium]
MAEFGLYIHIPFCERVCIYCDFYVTTARKHMDGFTQALMKEITLYAQRYPDASLRTVYFGGGTPSYLPAENLNTIMNQLRSSFDINQNAEITLEANPNNLSYDKLRDLRDIGINRLSIGVQSFREEDLKFLTRNHNSNQASESINYTRAAGFDNISIDLIFGLPEQTLITWEQSIAEALAFNPEHVSVYNLTVEERTHLNKLVQQKKIRVQDEEIEREMFLKTVQTLTKAGYEHYEISNYAKPGFRSQHNSSYWQGLSYLGLGPSAHSFHDERRWWNVRDINKYIEILNADGVLPIDMTEELNVQQECMEYIFLNLRKKEGLDIGEFEKIGGFNFFETFKNPLEKCKEFIIGDNGRVRLSDKGFFLYNKICEEFVSAL